MRGFWRISGLVLASVLLWAFAHPIAPPLMTKVDNVVAANGWQGLFAWFGLIPFLFAMQHLKGWKSFSAAAAFGLLFFAINQYWINIAVIMFGNISQGVALAIFFAQLIVIGLQWSLALHVSFAVHRRYNIRLSIILPLIFTGAELLRNYIPVGGYPWSNMAYSQWANLAFIQTASLWGVYGLTYIIVLFNTVLFEIILWKRGRLAAFPTTAALILLLLLGFSYPYGIYRMQANASAEQQAEHLKAAMIQGNIDQDTKNESMRNAYNIIHVYMGLSRQVRPDVELVIWPEGAYPFSMSKDTDNFHRYLGEYYDRLPWTLLMGVSNYATDEYGKRYYNSAWMLDHDMHVLERFDKSHLVPFGEYVPLGWLIKMRQIVPEAGQFFPGELGDGMTYANRRFGALICYEGIFPEISYHYARIGAQFIVNLTNDAWYGASSAPYQHMIFYVFRAIETRRFVLRAANTGFTAVVDSSGRILKHTNLFERTLMYADVPLLDERTFYSYAGEYPFWLLTFFYFFWLLRSARDWRREKKLLKKAR